jgi:hypothetical protein
MTVLVDPATGESLGIDVRNVGAGLPVAFSVPYSLTDIQPTQDYVVTAEVGDAGATWRNVAGVPVITKGNPKTAVQIVVTPVVVATPSPSATPLPTATPAPTAGPGPALGRSDSGGLLTLIILMAAIAALAAFFIARGRNSDEAPPPPEGVPARDSTAPAAAATTATPSADATDPAAPPADADATVPEPTTPGDPPAQT